MVRFLAAYDQPDDPAEFDRHLCENANWGGRHAGVAAPRQAGVDAGTDVRAAQQHRHVGGDPSAAHPCPRSGMMGACPRPTPPAA